MTVAWVIGEEASARNARDEAQVGEGLVMFAPVVKNIEKSVKCGLHVLWWDVEGRVGQLLGVHVRRRIGQRAGIRLNSRIGSMTKMRPD